MSPLDLNALKGAGGTHPGIARQAIEHRCIRHRHDTRGPHVEVEGRRGAEMAFLDVAVDIELRQPQHELVAALPLFPDVDVDLTCARNTGEKR